MQKKLQQILTDLTEISELRFALYRTPEEYVAGTLPQDACEPGQIAGLFSQVTEHMQLLTDHMYTAFPVHTANEMALLVTEGASAEVSVPCRMAARTVQLFFDAIRRELDKNAFAAALLAGEIPDGELYKLAGRVKLKDAPRVLYVFELAQPFPGHTALRMLTSLFADGRQDLLFLQDETHLVCIKAYDGDVTPEQVYEYAISAVDTMLSELMIKTRVGYSTKKLTLAELKDARREAALALQISGIFQEEREVAAYSKLGIARLIHELPADLCELFLHEVFGEHLPDQEIDEEMQVTIRLFFENNLNISETARRLFLHRNTLVYRLERFEKLVGLDIRKFDDAMTFQIAMMVLAHYRQL